MPTERLSDDAWRSVTLTADEIWQCRDGQVLTTVEALSSPTSDQGIVLGVRDIRFFAAGQVVRYRRLQPEGVVIEARICRELTV